jgi:hypothetical protein
MLGWKTGASGSPIKPPRGSPIVQIEAYLAGHRDGTKAYQEAENSSFCSDRRPT